MAKKYLHASKQKVYGIMIIGRKNRGAGSENYSENNFLETSDNTSVMCSKSLWYSKRDAFAQTLWRQCEWCNNSQHIIRPHSITAPWIHAAKALSILSVNWDIPVWHLVFSIPSIRNKIWNGWQYERKWMIVVGEKWEYACTKQNRCSMQKRWILYMYLCMCWTVAVPVVSIIIVIDTFYVEQYQYVSVVHPTQWLCV